jgi:hypothetical protein
LKKLLILLCCFSILSCFGDDDGILDGDLITAIISEDQIFTTSGGSVDYEFTEGDNGGMSQAFISSFVFSEQFSMNLFLPSDLQNNLVITDFQSNSFLYSTDIDNVRVAYRLDTSANNRLEILRVNKNSIEGRFEITMVNAMNSTDTIDFKEGYFYCYD